MPIFEYICGECGHGFEAIVQGGRTPECPACGGLRLEQQLSSFAVGASRAQVAPRRSSCGSCGDPRGPGACSLD